MSKAKQTSKPWKPTPGLCLKPAYVRDRIKDHLEILRQDFATLEKGWVCIDRGDWPGKSSGVTDSEYLRSLLLTFRAIGKSKPSDATPAAWSPFIAEYLQVLAIPHEPVPGLFQAFTTGDVMDREEMMAIALLAFHVLEMALDVVDQQYLDGYQAIVSRR